MNTATIHPIHTPSRSRRTPQHLRPQSRPLPAEDFDNLIVRFAGADESDASADLAARASAQRPAGALMVGALDGKLLAAVSMTSGEALVDPTPSGAAAAAVVRHTLGTLGRRHRTPRKTGTPS